MDAAFGADRAAAEAVAEELRADGHEPRIIRVRDRAPDDPEKGPLGYLVRVGSFATQAEADALRSELTAKGYAQLRTVYTCEDGGKPTGPSVVHALRVNPGRSKVSFRILFARSPRGTASHQRSRRFLGRRRGEVGPLAWVAPQFP